MEFFARVEIRESVNEAGESDELLEAAIKTIRAAVADLGWGDLASDRNQVAEVRLMNGSPIVIIHGASNHDGGKSQKLTGLLRLIGDVAPGSFGFAWHLDMEHQDGWVVHTLIRGEVAQREDPWFSPIIPTVEDIDPRSIPTELTTPR